MTASGSVKLKPGDTIGILGGGQLGRMLAMAAARLGLRCQVFSPDPDSPAFDVVLNATCAEYADVEALELFANDVDLITYEFENVPAATAMVLAARRPVLPDELHGGGAGERAEHGRRLGRLDLLQRPLVVAGAGVRLVAAPDRILDQPRVQPAEALAEAVHGVGADPTADAVGSFEDAEADAALGEPLAAA